MHLSEALGPLQRGTTVITWSGLQVPFWKLPDAQLPGNTLGALGGGGRWRWQVPPGGSGERTGSYLRERLHLITERAREPKCLRELQSVVEIELCLHLTRKLTLSRELKAEGIGVAFPRQP